MLCFVPQSDRFQITASKIEKDPTIPADTWLGNPVLPAAVISRFHSAYFLNKPQKWQPPSPTTDSIPA